jgi:hypothetical protein
VPVIFTHRLILAQALPVSRDNPAAAQPLINLLHPAEF